MVRWQNQGDPGYATPSSSDEDEDEWLTKKVPREKYTLSDIKCQYPTEENKSSDFPFRDFTSNLNVGDRLSRNGQDGLVCHSTDWGGQNARSPGGGVWPQMCDHEVSLTQDLSALSLQCSPRRSSSRVLKEYNLEFDADNRHHNFLLHPEQYKPPTVKVKQDESVQAKPEPEWMGDGSLEFSLQSKTSESTSNNSNKLQSFLSLLKQGKYLLTPEKSKPISMQLSAIHSPSFPKSSRGDRWNNSGLMLTPPRQNHCDHFPQLEDPEQWHSPIPTFNYLGHQIAEYQVDDHEAPEYSYSEQEPAEKEVDNWSYRVLFPPVDTPVRKRKEQL